MINKKRINKMIFSSMDIDLEFYLRASRKKKILLAKKKIEAEHYLIEEIIKKMMMEININGKNGTR